MQESAVVVNGYSGAYGGSAGANINYATKSGSNKFHGNAIYWWNGDAMNANNYFLNQNGYSAAIRERRSVRWIHGRTDQEGQGVLLLRLRRNISGDSGGAAGFGHIIQTASSPTSIFGYDVGADASARLIRLQGKFVL